MNVNAQVNGFFLLLSFGLLYGVIAGTVFGMGMALYWQTVGRVGNDINLFFVLSGIGAAFGSVPGVLYGLSSYYFKKNLTGFLRQDFTAFYPASFYMLDWGLIGVYC